MNRFTRIFAMAVGSVALFAVFAVAGWAITDRFTSEESAPAVLETVALEEYQLIPAEGDVEEQFARIDAQQPIALPPESDEAPPAASQSDTGGAVAANTAPDRAQTARIVPRALVDVVEDPDAPDAAGSAPPDDTATSSTSTIGDTADTSVPDDEGIDEDALPGTIDDAPFLFDDLGLRGRLVADPLGPIRIDLCAGATVGLDVPAECPTGVGGIVAVVDDGVDSLINASVFDPNTASDRCGPSDETTWKLLVRMATPGTLNLTLWEGARDSSPPSGAFFRAIEVPPDTAEAMTASLDDGATGADAVAFFFCIEVPAMTKNTPIVAEHFVVSSYPADGGARGPIFQDEVSLYEADPRTGLRPPSLIWGAPGTDDVVNAIVYKKEHERTWVKAVEIPLTWIFVRDVCNTDGSPIGPAGPVPSGMTSPSGDTIIVGEFVRTSSIGTSGSWPYDPLIDNADRLQLQLTPGLTYALCTYVVMGEDTLSPRVVHSEATFVATPTTREIDIEISGIETTDIAPTAERVEFSVRPQIEGCRGGNVEYPGPVYDSIFGQDLLICVGSASGVRAAGGFAIKVQSFSRAEGNGWGNTNEAWIPVDPSELTCIWDCRETLERVVRLPAPGDVLRPTRRGGVTIAEITLTIRFTPPPVRGFPEWTIGPVGTFDNTNPEPPAEPVIRWETTSSGRLTDPLSGTFAASLAGVVTADRPVRIDAVSFDYSIPTFDCEVDGFDLDFDEESPEFKDRHELTFEGLCLGATYRLAIEVTDRSGSRTMKIYTVYTEAPRIVLRARLEIGPLVYGTPGPSRRFVEFRPLEGVRELSPYNSPTVGAIYTLGGAVSNEEDLGGWKTDATRYRDFRICDGFSYTFGPAPRLWEVETGGYSYLEFATNVRIGTYLHSNTDVNCELHPEFGDSRDILAEVRLSGVMTLNELFDGVEIVDSSAPGMPKLILTAEWAR